MNYELAKKLKDAGFGQFSKRTKVDIKNMSAPGFYLSEGDEPAVMNKNLCYVPTLSELIEACVPNFGVLDYYHGELWTACSAKNTGLYGTGINPEEAVANLWLALQTQ